MSAKTKPQPVVDTKAGVINVYRPADGLLIEKVPIDDPARVVAAAAALREAQAEWEDIGLAARTKWLQRYRDWLFDNTDRLADLTQQELGRVRAEAVLEPNGLGDVVNTYARCAPRLLAAKRLPGSSALMLGKAFHQQRRPYPLVGVIGSWNFPLLLSLGDGIPALFAGAAVLLKPSEVSPLTVREAVRGWREDLGAPPVLDVVNGGGETGAALIDAVDYVQFTGSTATGKLVAQRAAETVTPVSLELGGKDPAIVLADANLERAVNGTVYGALANNGQVCMSIERVYAEAPIYDEFVRDVVAKVQSLRSGMDGPEIGAELGAITSAAQIDIVDGHVRDAVAKGARILTGGQRIDRPGQWYAPTVLVDVDHSMQVMTEESFGPLLPIMKVADADEAIRLANDSAYGLSASVFAAPATGMAVAKRLDVGTVNVNDYIVASLNSTVPMAGWKTSGIGSRSGEYGLLKYTRAKSISTSRGPMLDNDPHWFPYTFRRNALVRAAFRLVHARGLRRLWRPTWPAA